MGNKKGCQFGKLVGCRTYSSSFHSHMYTKIGCCVPPSRGEGDEWECTHAIPRLRKWVRNRCAMKGGSFSQTLLKKDALFKKFCFLTAKFHFFFLRKMMFFQASKPNSTFRDTDPGPNRSRTLSDSSYATG